MADRFPAKIRIGGQLSRTARIPHDDEYTIFQGLVSALEDDKASHGYGDAVIPGDCSEKELLDKYSDEGVLIFKNDEACNGEFAQMEEFCVQHGIPFDRWSDGENVYFRPGMVMKVPVTRFVDSNGNEIVSGEMVREALGSLTNERRSLLVRLDSAIRQLKAACPDLPDSLPKFEMVA